MRILLVLITGAALCGCTGGALSLKSWEGQPVNDLIYAWGPPTRDASLPDGRRVVAYTPQHPYGSGANAILRRTVSGESRRSCRNDGDHGRSKLLPRPFVG